MRRRLIAALALAAWPFALLACTDDDPEPEGTSTTAATSAPVSVDDVAAAFEAAGYDVSEVLYDAPSADPNGAVGHGGLEISGGDLPDAADLELWVFADDAAAAEGATQVADDATDPDADGGSFVRRNSSVVALFGCVCEGDVAVAEVFADLTFGVTSDVTTDGALGPEELLADVGVEAEATEDEPRWLVGGSPVVLEASIDDEAERVEAHVFDDATEAQQGAEQIESEWDDYCGGVCEEVGPEVVVIDTVVFVGAEGSEALAALSEG